MPKVSSKMQSWQVFHYARKHLGRSVLYSIFGKKNARAVDYWCEDPKYTNKPDGAYDPIQGVRDLMTALDDHGHTAVIRSACQYMTAETSGAAEEAPTNLTDLLPTLEAEILADFRAIANLQAMIESGSDMALILAAKQEAIEEIERTVAFYIKEQATA